VSALSINKEKYKKKEEKNTYTIRNLLPASAICPLALVAEAVLVHIHEPLSALEGQLRQGSGAISQFLERAGAVAVDDDISLEQQFLEYLAARRRLEVEIRAVLAHVDVDLEEGHVGQVRRRHLQHVGAVLGQDARDDRPGDDAAQLEDLDAAEDAVLGARLVLGQRDGRRGGLKGCDGPGREIDVVLAVRRGDEVLVLERGDAGLAQLLVLCLEFLNGELLDVRLDAVRDLLDGLEIGAVGGQADHVKCRVCLEGAVDVEIGVWGLGGVEVGGHATVGVGLGFKEVRIYPSVSFAMSC